MLVIIDTEICLGASFAASTRLAQTREELYKTFGLEEDPGDGI